jgi:hypothetical protein
MFYLLHRRPAGTGPVRIGVERAWPACGCARVEAVMKRLIVASLLVLAAFPAHAISRYNSMSMSCAAAHQRIVQEGAVILRYPSARHPNLTLYDRYVRDGGFCDMGEGAIPDTIPTRDNPQCLVFKCRDITFDEPDN